jgi:hypothetical protein
MATTWRPTSSPTGILIVAVLLSTKYISECKKVLISCRENQALCQSYSRQEWLLGLLNYGLESDNKS